MIIKYKYIIKYAIKYANKRIHRKSRQTLNSRHTLSLWPLPWPFRHVASDGLRCPEQTGRRLECARHCYHGRWNVPGQPSASSPSPKQILTVREGAASSSSLMSCDSCCSQTAAPTSVWLGPHSSCQTSEKRDPSSKGRAVREGCNSSPTSVCTGGSDASNHWDLEKDWGKASPYKRGGKNPREASAQ